MDVAVKDSNEAIHQINTDVLSDGSETQIVKLQLGDEGVDGGTASKQNPIMVEVGGLFKTIRALFGKFSFDGTSQLRTTVSGYVSVSSGTVTTVGTMTTGNIGIGDWGKASTAQQQSQQAFMMGIRQNFVRV